MATVVYVPQSGRDEALSAGIMDAGKSIALNMQRKEKDARMQKILQGISAAPDHKTGAQIIAASAVGAEPDELAVYFKALDELHPKDQDSLIESKVYSPVTGAETPFWVHQSQVKNLKDPKFISEITGLPEDSFSLTKPVKTHDYIDPASGNSVGTFVPGMQPAGTISAEDFKRDIDIRSATRQDNQFAVSEQNMMINQRRLDETERANQERERLAARREARQGSIDNSDKELKRVSIEQTRLYKHIATKHGGVIQPDGSIDISKVAGPSKEQIEEEFGLGSQMLEDGTVKVWGQAVRELAKRSKLVPRDDKPVIPEELSKQGVKGIIPEEKRKQYQQFKSAWESTKNPEVRKKLEVEAKKRGLIK